MTLALFRRGRRRTALVLSAAAVLVAAVPVPRERSVPCDADNGGLVLPPGFCATIFADKLQAPRHMVVASNGDVIVNGNPLRTAAEAGGAVSGGRLVLLRDTDGDGKADTTIRLAGGGGTGLWLANGALYATAGRAIVGSIRPACRGPIPRRICAASPKPPSIPAWACSNPPSRSDAGRTLRLKSWARRTSARQNWRRN